MEEKKEKGNFWLTVATFIVNKRKAIYVLFFIAIIYSVVSVNKVSVNQDITKYLPADSETNRGLNLMEEQFLTYGSARVMVSNITYTDAQKLVDELEAVKGVKEVAFDDSEDHYTGTNALYDITFSGEEEEQVSKDAMNAVRETLADYDTYVSTEVGAEEETSKALAKDMNLILVLAVIIIGCGAAAFHKSIYGNSGAADYLWRGGHFEQGDQLLAGDYLQRHRFHCGGAAAGAGD